MIQLIFLKYTFFSTSLLCYIEQLMDTSLFTFHLFLLSSALSFCIWTDVTYFNREKLMFLSFDNITGLHRDTAGLVPEHHSKANPENYLCSSSYKIYVYTLYYSLLNMQLHYFLKKVHTLI